jgi:NADH dehydrogenase
MAQIFLTGGSGFIGRFVLDQLVDSGHEIRMLVHRSRPAPLHPSCRIINGDLLEPDGYVAELRGVDAVLHMAAATGRASRAEHERINADGTRAVVDACARAGVGRLLFISSIAVRFPDAPHYHYAAAKRAAEDIVRGSGLAFSILRPTIVLGPGSPIGTALRSLARLPVMPIFGDGRARVQPVDVRDLAAVITSVLHHDRFRNEVAEVGGPEQISLKEMLCRLRMRVRGSTAGVVHVPLRPLRAALGLLETLLPVTPPLTAGQLATFANDGVARPLPFPWPAGVPARGIDAMLDELATDG